MRHISHRGGYGGHNHQIIGMSLAGAFGGMYNKNRGGTFLDGCAMGIFIYLIGLVAGAIFALVLIRLIGSIGY